MKKFTNRKQRIEFIRRKKGREFVQFLFTDMTDREVKIFFDTMYPVLKSLPDVQETFSIPKKKKEKTAGAVTLKTAVRLTGLKDKEECRIRQQGNELDDAQILEVSTMRDIYDMKHTVVTGIYPWFSGADYCGLEFEIAGKLQNVNNS